MLIWWIFILKFYSTIEFISKNIHRQNKMNRIVRELRVLGMNGIILFGLTFITISFAFSWGATAHHIINLKAPMDLPASMSIWRADSLLFATHASDADNRKNSKDTSFWAEAPRHFIDIDWYPNFQSLPHSLDSVIMLYGRSTVWTQGTLPWAMVRELDSLTAQFRRNDTAIVQTMSDLGHYVGDAHQPLHCTENYDGAMTGNKGIHSRYETGMIDMFQNSIVPYQDSIHYVSSPLDFVFNYIYHSQIYVDSIMQADTYAKSISGWNGSGNPPTAYYTALWQKVGPFTIDQIQRATVALASLWYTAWVNSQTPIDQDTIIAGAGTNGSIFPSGIVILGYGSNQKFSFTPAAGYHVDTVFVDGIVQPPDTTYTLTNLSANHSITVTFAINHYKITATAGVNGSVVPAGLIDVVYGDSMAFVFHPDSACRVDSVFIDSVYAGKDTACVFRHITANHTLNVRFNDGSVSLSCNIADKWNILSVPLTMKDYRRSVLFPTAISGAFAYNGSYQMADTLQNGVAYWIKFTGAQNVILSGRVRATDTFFVNEGWNMIGSLSFAIPVTNIISSPGGIVTSGVFGYSDGYKITDSILPGYGYWVKTSQAGQFILSSGTQANAENRIRIVPVGDNPPPPPADESISSGIPKDFELAQAYPNPFNPSTTIHFELPAETHVSLKIYNMLGQEVQTVMDENRTAGRYDIHVDASTLASGVYFYRLNAGIFSRTMKMILSK
jgi:hypothetical protein